LADQTVHVRVEQRQSRRGAPVPEQTRLDVLGAEGFAQQRIGLEIDLADGQVVRRAPPGIQQVQFARTEGMRHDSSSTRQRTLRPQRLKWSGEAVPGWCRSHASWVFPSASSDCPTWA